MKIIYTNETQEMVDAAIDAADDAGRSIRKILLFKWERHALYSTGEVLKADPHHPDLVPGYRGLYRAIPIYAQEECE